MYRLNIPREQQPLYRRGNVDISMKTRDLSPWRIFVVIMFIIFFIVLGGSIHHQEYLPIMIVLIGANLLMFLKYCLDYFDYSRISLRNRFYREQRPTDIILDVHNSKYYLGTYAARIEADGQRIADISKGRNAKVPIPKNTQRLTISMRGTPNVIELTDYSPDIRIYTWVKFSKNGDRHLEVTCISGEEKFNETRVFEMYSAALKLRQENAIWGIFLSFIPLIIVITFIVIPVF